MKPPQRTQYLLDCLPQIKAYLLSEVLYWPMGGSPLPLTIGNFLLENKVHAISNSIEEQQFTRAIGLTRQTWLTKWNRKVEREFLGRLKLWSSYLASIEGEQRPSIAQYKNEVRNRVILQLLTKEMDQTLPDLDLVDTGLKKFFTDDIFLWDPELQDVFDKQDFWFLFGKLNDR